MGKSKHFIPTLRSPDECRDWMDRNKPLPTVHRGDVWFARLGEHRYSSVQEGVRPVLIVSNEKSNRSSCTVTAIPFTGQLKRTDMPTHVVFDRITKGEDDGKPEGCGKPRGAEEPPSAGELGARGKSHGRGQPAHGDEKPNGNGKPPHGGNSEDEEKSVALVEQVTTIDKRRLLNRAGHFDSAKMKKVNRALLIQLGLDEEVE